LLFNSLIFTIFLPIVFIGYWIIPVKYRNFFLLLASYYFYYSYNPWFLLLLIGTSAFDFWCAKQIQNHRPRKKFYLFLSLFSNLGVLAAFKYSAFFYNTLFGSFQMLTNSQFNPVENFVIPAGLSFYTFQSISYTIDVYREKYKADDTLYDFLLYVSFFPHMVAGPIVRHNSLMPQLKALNFFKNIDWKGFALLTTWGYFKKLVIADNLSLVVSPMFDNVTGFTGEELLAGGFLFVIQVYCDFSGYSDIATGVAKLFNINLSLNWRRPLLSTSLHEFWTRNHISITTWFRDYLYIGLGGNRVPYNRWLLNIFLVFVISGLWHGANITFVIWGCLHGIFYIFEILLRKIFPRFRVPKFMGWMYLIIFHTVSLIAFRANNAQDLVYIYGKIFNPYSWDSFKHLLNVQDRFFYLIMTFMILILFLKELNEEFAIMNRHEKLYRFAKPALYICFIVLIFVIGNFSANTFIYFQF
jgi:alginate O-acetyltransferase complex protein AlgI